VITLLAMRLSPSRFCDKANVCATVSRRWEALYAARDTSSTASVRHLASCLAGDALNVFYSPVTYTVRIQSLNLRPMGG